MRVNLDRVIRDIEKFINRLKSGKTINLVKWEENRTLDATNGTLGDLANALATLIDDLKKKGI